MVSHFYVVLRLGLNGDAHTLPLMSLWHVNKKVNLSFLIRVVSLLDICKQYVFGRTMNVP